MHIKLRHYFPRINDPLPWQDSLWVCSSSLSGLKIIKVTWMTGNRTAREVQALDNLMALARRGTSTFFLPLGSLKFNPPHHQLYEEKKTRWWA